MTYKYVLTGGPGTGKSSIILALEQRGEYVIREAAEDYIRLRQAQGQKEPWTEENFQEEILELQIQREARIPKEAKRVFIDRGVHDGLAYATPGTETYEEILKTLMEEVEVPISAERLKLFRDIGILVPVDATDFELKYRYDKVYFIENLGSTEKTEVRRENQDEAIALGNKIREIYAKQFNYSTVLGSSIINIPAGPLEERVAKILETA